MAPAMPGLAEASVSCAVWCSGHTDASDPADQTHFSDGIELGMSLEGRIDDDNAAFLEVFIQQRTGRPATVGVLFNEEPRGLTLDPVDAGRVARMLHRLALRSRPVVETVVRDPGADVLAERTAGAVLLIPDADKADTFHLAPGEAAELARALQHHAELATARPCPAWCEVEHRGPVRAGRLHSVTTFTDSAGLVMTAQQWEAPDGTLGEVAVCSYDEAAGVLAAVALAGP